MLRKATGCFVLWSVLVPWTAHADPVLNVVGGELVGALGVDVGGTLYDVEFVDGTCIAIFGGCDEVSDFAFQSQTEAITAAQALFDQVWLDGVLGLFDTVTALTNGCGGFDDVCNAYVPYSIVDSSSFQAAKAHNSDNGLYDLVFTGVWHADGPVATSVENVYAKFQPTAVSVPEPSALLLLGTGLVGLVCIRRRKQ